MVRFEKSKVYCNAKEDWIAFCFDSINRDENNAGRIDGSVICFFEKGENGAWKRAEVSVVYSVVSEDNVIGCEFVCISHRSKNHDGFEQIVVRATDAIDVTEFENL